MLKLDDISFSRQGTPVLSKVSLEINSGEIVALLGPNGSGKTTLMRCILGQLKLDAGEISLRGTENSVSNVPLVSWVPQRVTFFPLLTVAQNLTEFGRLMGVPAQGLGDRVDEVLSLIGLGSRADDLAKSLSGGMQRMLNVGIGLVSSPQLLMIDEPTAGIDRAAHERLYAVLAELRAKGLGILLTTHDLNDVSRLASRAVILARGKICAQGSVDELIHERFKDHKEVRIHLSSTAANNGLLVQSLSRFGLQATGDDIWQGLASQSDGQLDQLYQAVSAHEDLIKEFSLRNPGLELLIEAVTNEAEASR